MARENSINKRYSKLEKEKLIARMLPPENISVSDLSKETGISKSTLQTWKTKAGNPKNSENNTVKRVVTPKDRFLIVMKTYLLSEAELARYCREKDLQLKEKALTETATLLVLRKKLQAILVENVED